MWRSKMEEIFVSKKCKTKTTVQDYHKSEISVDFQLEIDFSEW